MCQNNDYVWSKPTVVQNTNCCGARVGGGGPQVRDIVHLFPTPFLLAVQSSRLEALRTLPRAYMYELRKWAVAHTQALRA
jgi:hypothetical protein